MHVGRGFITCGALRRRPLRAAWPCILDPRHRRGGLRCRLIAATRLPIRLAVAATGITTAILAVTVLAVAMVASAMPIMSRVAMTACACGSFALGRRRRLAHPGNALTDQ